LQHRSLLFVLWQTSQIFDNVISLHFTATRDPSKIDILRFCEKFGVDPPLIPDLLALVGDAAE